MLDVPAEVGLARAAARRGLATADRFEAEDLGFHRKLRDAFRQITVDDPLRCVLVAADADIATVAERVWAALTEKLTVPAQPANLAATGA